MLALKRFWEKELISYLKADSIENGGSHQPSVMRYVGNSLSYIAIYPVVSLQDKVEFYYQCESSIIELPGSFPDLYTIFLPLNCVEMIFNYHDTSVCLRSNRNSSQSHGKIVGQHNLQTICRADNITKTNKTFHVRFKPGAFQDLFGIPQILLKNSCFSAREVLGKEAEILEDALNNSDSLAARVEIIERFLSTRLGSLASRKKNNPADSAVRLIESHHGKINVRGLRQCLGLTERRLERSFSSSVGLSPKEFIRVVRFKRVLAEMTSRKHSAWEELRESHDYYDDSHFIKEFKAATTVAPGYFRKQLEKKIVKSVNFLVFRETPAPHQDGFLKDCLELEKQAQGLF